MIEIEIVILSAASRSFTARGAVEGPASAIATGVDRVDNRGGLLADAEFGGCGELVGRAVDDGGSGYTYSLTTTYDSGDFAANPPCNLNIP